MCKDRILIIENQKSQFKEIRTKLCPDFTVFPEVENFVKFADWARISLTKRYDNAEQQDPGKRRRQATRDIADYINDKEIDVILIDHVLVGHHSGENGIHLARKLKDLEIEQPIIFLSRNEKNKESVKEDLEKESITDPIWVEKGYAGQGIGDDWYFKKNVVEKIKECIGQSINLLFDKLVNSALGSDYREKINNLRERPLSNLQKKQLKNFCAQNFATKEIKDLEELINDLKNGQ